MKDGREKRYKGVAGEVILLDLGPQLLDDAHVAVLVDDRLVDDVLGAVGCGVRVRSDIRQLNLTCTVTRWISRRM